MISFLCIVSQNVIHFSWGVYDFGSFYLDRFYIYLNLENNLAFPFVFLSSIKSSWDQLRIEGHFGFHTFWTKFCNILKDGMNLKFKTIVQIFRKIMQLSAVIILKSANEYYRKII